MSSSRVDDNLIHAVFTWFQSTMKIAGRRVNYPKCKDPTKTYQFRAIKAFAVKCYDEWGLDDRVVRVLISDLVIYAKNHKMLHLGANLLCSANILGVCQQSIKTLMDDEAVLLKELELSNRFLSDQSDDKNNLVQVLIGPVDEGGEPRLIYWRNLGYITDSYISLSKTCIRALSQIPIEKKAGMPSNFELLRMCTHILSDDMLPKVNEVLNSDLRIPPTITI